MVGRGAWGRFTAQWESMVDGRGQDRTHSKHFQCPWLQAIPVACLLPDHSMVSSRPTKIDGKHEEESEEVSTDHIHTVVQLF